MRYSIYDLSPGYNGNFVPGALLGIFESADETQVGEIHPLGASNNLNPVSIFPNGLS